MMDIRTSEVINILSKRREEKTSAYILSIPLKKMIINSFIRITKKMRLANSPMEGHNRTSQDFKNSSSKQRILKRPEINRSWPKEKNSLSSFIIKKILEQKKRTTIF